MRYLDLSQEVPITRANRPKVLGKAGATEHVPTRRSKALGRAVRRLWLRSSSSTYCRHAEGITRGEAGGTPRGQAARRRGGAAAHAILQGLGPAREGDSAERRKIRLRCT